MAPAAKITPHTAHLNPNGLGLDGRLVMVPDPAGEGGEVVGEVVQGVAVALGGSDAGGGVGEGGNQRD